MKENLRALLPDLVGEFWDKLVSHNLVKRPLCFPDLPQKIRVAIGMRRTGKSFFLFQTIQKLLDNGIQPEQILFINFEDERLLPFSAEDLGQLVIIL
ncbi:MAG: AAA family ATPase [Deltaproteobacteria bacterium]|nr:AAA family ATPase [Deltaproteobacteria bacterium]